ncbi:MAG: hypothetical protein AB7F43_06790 [Bacteriovoracia bacterium]
MKNLFALGLVLTLFLGLSVNRSKAAMPMPGCYTLKSYCMSGMPYGPAPMPTFLSPFQSLPMFPQTNYYQMPMLGQNTYYQPNIIYGGRPYMTPYYGQSMFGGSPTFGSFGGTVYGSGF